MADGVTREAACACGRLALTMRGEPVLVSACCCTRCQRRTGSYFGVTAYFRAEQVVVRRGEARPFRQTEASVPRYFCGDCGGSLWWGPFEDDAGDVIGVAGGAFADPTLPGPHRMTHAATGHPFVTSPEGIPVYADGPPED